jgi:DNA repair protein RadA/Sms
MVNDESDGLLGVNIQDYGEIRLTNNLDWLRYRIDKFVKGGVYLLAGEPGIGKTTLALQIAMDLGIQDIKTLYILNEQSKSEIARRAKQISSEWSSNDREKALRVVHPIGTEDGLYDDISNLPTFLTHQVLGQAGRYHSFGAKLIVVDSIQGQGLSSVATKQYRQVYDFCRRCKTEGITTLLIAHVTKRGEIAGPKDLQHNVDCVLYMRKALAYRPLFVPKNRFGPAVLHAIPLEMDRITTALRLSPHSESVSTVARTFLGQPYGIAEAQAAVALPSLGSRPQIIAPGLPRKEIEQLVNCISQIPDMDIGDLSYTIQCRLPGEQRYRSIMGLPLAIALIASYLQREIPKHHLYIGELDLLRQVREVPDSIIEDLWNAIEAKEITTPIRIFCPIESAPFIRDGMKDATVVACDRLEAALYNTWADLRPKIENKG